MKGCRLTVLLTDVVMFDVNVEKKALPEEGGELILLLLSLLLSFCCGCLVAAAESLDSPALFPLTSLLLPKKDPAIPPMTFQRDDELPLALGPAAGGGFDESAAAMLSDAPLLSFCGGRSTIVGPGDEPPPPPSTSEAAFIMFIEGRGDKWVVVGVSWGIGVRW